MVSNEFTEDEEDLSQCCKGFTAFKLPSRASVDILIGWPSSHPSSVHLIWSDFKARLSRLFPCFKSSNYFKRKNYSNCTLICKKKLLINIITYLRMQWLLLQKIPNVARALSKIITSCQCVCNRIDLGIGRYICSLYLRAPMGMGPNQAFY